ncbi:MAG: DUF4062 domain-containing protein [Elusimicrobia bacterium]|nr:DUF4062 domain-containing protein [Elusimicrobiota bacterium]
MRSGDGNSRVVVNFIDEAGIQWLIEVLTEYRAYLEGEKRKIRNRFGYKVQLDKELLDEIGYVDWCIKHAQQERPLAYGGEALGIIRSTYEFKFKNLNEEIADLEEKGATEEMLGPYRREVRDILDSGIYKNVPSREPYKSDLTFNEELIAAAQSSLLSPLTVLTNGKKLAKTPPSDALKIMISSTVKDLSPERDALDAVIESMNFIRLRSEKMAPEASPSKGVCRKMAEECDILCLIIGERYGFKVAGTNVSVTEFEFQIAKKHDPKKILVFVKKLSSGEREKEAEDFLSRVGDFENGYFYGQRFATVEQLIELASSAITRWVSERARLGTHRLGVAVANKVED